MKKYPTLDLFRVLCAGLVVVIHLGTSKETPIASMIVTCFSRQAVPFFFIVSGFFFANKIETVEDKKSFVLAYVRKLVIFYGIWVLLLLPQTIVSYFQLYENRSWVYIAMVIMRRIFLAGLAQFWYILVLAETAWIAGILLINNKRRILYGIACVGFFMGIIYSMELPHPVFEVYNSIVYSIFSWDCNFLMAGLPFFTVGVFIANHNSVINRLHPTKLVCTYILVSAAAVACYIVAQIKEINPDRVLYFYAVQATLLFLIGIRMTDTPISNQFAAGCREISSAIYCLHNLAIEYFLGEIMPWSGHFIVNYTAVISVCVIVYLVVKVLKIKPVYRIITLK